jgi:hypothetical protein
MMHGGFCVEGYTSLLGFLTYQGDLISFEQNRAIDHALDCDLA